MINERVVDIPDEMILSKIFVVRGIQVMMDHDLAGLYEVETKRLNEQVKRNIDRFPEDFMFQLTQDEYENLKSHNATSSWGGRRKLPYVFSEHGVLMLSSVLNSKKAIQVNIKIMRIYVRIRYMIHSYKEFLSRIESIEQSLVGHDEKIALIFEYLRQIEKQKQLDEEQAGRRRIGYRTDK